MKYGPMQICGCGTNHEAFDVALRLARNAIKPDSKDCVMWHAAVAQYYTITVQKLAVAQLFKDHPEIDQEMVHQAFSNMWHKVSALVVGGLFENNEQNAELAHFVCDEMQMGDATKENIQRGPSKANMEAMGIIAVEPTDDDEITIEKILDILFKRKD